LVSRTVSPIRVSGRTAAPFEGLREVLQKIGKAKPDAILGFYLRYDPDDELDETDGPYELWIAVVYSHAVQGAGEIASEAALRISNKLETAFKGPDGWRNIELAECKALSDDEFTLFEATVYSRYNLDYISLREGRVIDET
jgi:hypothetical protein